MNKEVLFYPPQEPEFRTINGIKYVVDYHPCSCSCHSTGAVHFSACCNNGWVECLRRVDDEPTDSSVIYEI